MKVIYINKRGFTRHFNSIPAADKVLRKINPNWKHDYPKTKYPEKMNTCIYQECSDEVFEKQLTRRLGYA